MLSMQCDKCDKYKKCNVIDTIGRMQYDTSWGWAKAHPGWDS